MRPSTPALDVNTNIVNVQLRGKDRLVTVIGGYPFYQSTGTNSQNENTWLPFHGFNCSSQGAMFAKLPANLDNLSWLAELPNGLSKNNELLQRFGGIDGICISYLMGGGFWNTSQGKEIGGALEKKYSDLISYLKPKVSELQKDLQSTSKPSFNCTVNREGTIEQIQTSVDQVGKNYGVLNEWLCQKSGRVPHLVHDKIAYLKPKTKEGVISYEDLFEKTQLSSARIPVPSNEAPLTMNTNSAAAASSGYNRDENIQVAVYLTQKTKMQWRCNEVGEVVFKDRVRVTDGLSREDAAAEVKKLIQTYSDSLNQKIASVGLRFVPDTVVAGSTTERSGGNTVEVIATYSTPAELHELFLLSQRETAQAAQSSAKRAEDFIAIEIVANKHIRFEEIDAQIIKRTNWLERSPMSCDIKVPKNNAQEIIAKLKMADGVLMIRPENGVSIQTEAGKKDQVSRQTQSAMLTGKQSFLGAAAAAAAAAASQAAPTVTTVAQLEKAYRDNAGYFNAASKIFEDKPDYETAITRLQERFKDAKHNYEKKGATYEALKAADRVPPAPEGKVTPRQ